RAPRRSSSICRVLRRRSFGAFSQRLPWPISATRGGAPTWSSCSPKRCPRTPTSSSRQPRCGAEDGMNRRSLLESAAATSAAGALGIELGCRPASAPDACASFPHADLEEKTIAELSAKMQRGEVSAVDLVDRYAARIEALDRAGPRLRSVLELDPDARG